MSAMWFRQDKVKLVGSFIDILIWEVIPPSWIVCMATSTAIQPQPVLTMRAIPAGYSCHLVSARYLISQLTISALMIPV
ncbi:hypothetical protein FLL37_20585 [Salmonella enterica]|nr:hypothetical protein [Salmonella enterica]